MVGYSFRENTSKFPICIIHDANLRVIVNNRSIDGCNMCKMKLNKVLRDQLCWR